MYSWKSIIRKINDLRLFQKNDWTRYTVMRKLPIVYLLFIVISSRPPVLVRIQRKKRPQALDYA